VPQEPRGKRRWHVVDGCGEFMPALAASLRCAACGCHSSFHRRAIVAEVPPTAVVVPIAPLPHLLRDGRGLLLPRAEGAPKPEDRSAGTTGGWESDTEVEGSDYDDGRPMSPLPAPDPHMLALTTGAPATAMNWQPAAPAPVPTQGTAVPGAPLASAWKRLRSKFSPEQKRRMRVLSERLGWRLQRRWRTAAARSASPGASSRSGCTTTSTTSSAASTARAARPRRLLPSRLRPPSLHRTLPSPPRPHRPRRLQHQRHRRRWGRRPESS
jgi:hypothetical protein